MGSLLKDILYSGPCIFIYNLLTLKNHLFEDHQHKYNKKYITDTTSTQKNVKNIQEGALHSIYEEISIENDQYYLPTSIKSSLEEQKKHKHINPQCKYCNRIIYENHILFRFLDENFCSKYCVETIKHRYENEI